MPKNQKNKTFWVESLTIWGILFLILHQGFAAYDVFFDEHKASVQALKFLAIVTKILPVRFHPAGLSLNQKDENGLALEYYRADYLCTIVDGFCETHLSSEPDWLQNMAKCFISAQIMDHIIFITMVLYRIQKEESNEPVIYLPGHYLNSLVKDFFKSQIRVESIPSITAFLRLAVIPFWLIVRTGVQQLFHTDVRGNIREHQKAPAVWIELAPKSGVWKQLEEFIASSSAGRTYDIVYYLDRPDTSVTSAIIKELENQGFGWIDTRNMLHARLWARDYFRLIAGFFDSLHKHHLWFAFFLFRFEIMRAFYQSLYKRFNVRLLFQHQETSWLMEAQRQAIESAGGIMVGLHWSNYLSNQYPCHLNPQHVMLVWGRAHEEYLETKGNTCSHIIPCGVWVAGSGATPEEIKPPQPGDFILAIFDSSVWYAMHQSPENLSKFYLEIISILEDNPLFSGIMKSKSSQVADLRHLPAGEEIEHRLLSLEKAGRLRILDWERHSPVDAAQAADLSVCFGLNSAGIVAGLLGFRAVHWDCTGWLKHRIYQDKDQQVLFATLPELRQAVRRAAVGDKTVGSFDKWRPQINHFNDCAGRERIMRFINLYMEEAGASITGLDSAVKQYLSEQVGSEIMNPPGVPANSRNLS